MLVVFNQILRATLWKKPRFIGKNKVIGSIGTLYQTLRCWPDARSPTLGTPCARVDVPLKDLATATQVPVIWQRKALAADFPSMR